MIDAVPPESSLEITTQMCILAIWWYLGCNMFSSISANFFSFSLCLSHKILYMLITKIWMSQI